MNYLITEEAAPKKKGFVFPFKPSLLASGVFLLGTTFLSGVFFNDYPIAAIIPVGFLLVISWEAK